MSHCSRTCVGTLFVEIYIFSFLFYLFVVFNVFVPCSHPPLLCPHLPNILIFPIILNCFPHQITALGQHAKSNISTLQKPSIQMFETMSTRLEMEKCSKSQQHQRVNQREFQTMATQTSYSHLLCCNTIGKDFDTTRVSFNLTMAAIKDTLPSMARHSSASSAPRSTCSSKNQELRRRCSLENQELCRVWRATPT